MSRNRLVIFSAFFLAPLGAWANCPAIPSQCPNANNNSVSTNILQNYGEVLSQTGTNVTPRININNSVTGTWSSANPIINQVSITADTARGDTWPDAAAAWETNYAWGGTPSVPAGSGGRYANRSFTNVGTLLPSSTPGISFPYVVNTELKSTVSGNLGGASHASIWGSQYTLNLVATMASGATHLGTNTNGEFDISSYYGSDSATEANLYFVRLGLDWGNIGYGGQPFGVGDQRSGRYVLYFGSNQATTDTTTLASQTATAGQQLPSMSQAIAMSIDLFDQYSTVFGFQYLANPNTNSCAACGPAGAPVAAPIRRPPTVGSVMDGHMLNVVNQAWWTSGFEVQGNGELDLGSAKLSPTNTTTGLTIDISGQYVATVVPHGTWGPKAVGEQVFDNYGGLYKVTSVDGSGNVTGYAIVPGRPGYTQSGSPCTSGCQVFGSGAPALVDLTWTTPTALNLNPTGRDVILPYLRITNAGGPQFSGNVQCTACDFVLGNGRALFLQDTANHNVNIKTSADVTALTGVDSSNSTSTVWSYLNNQSTLQPLVVWKPLELLSYVEHSGTIPGTPTSCGTSPSMIGGSTDVAGIISVGTGSTTTCSMPFATTRSINPVCVVNAHIAGTPILVSVTTESTTGFTVQSTSNMASAAIRYHCL